MSGSTSCAHDSQICRYNWAGRGLGQHLACRFWEAGYSLGLVARNAASLDETRSRLSRTEAKKCDVFACDLSDPASVQNLVAEICAMTVQINVVINNAAIQGPIGPLQQNDLGDWEQTIRVNLISPVVICRGLLPRMANARRGFDPQSLGRRGDRSAR